MQPLSWLKRLKVLWAILALVGLAYFPFLFILDATVAGHSLNHPRYPVIAAAVFQASAMAWYLSRSRKNRQDAIEAT